MTIAAVILAVGKGTRSADPLTPKLAQMVGDCSLMEWHLILLEPTKISEVIVVAGHLGDQVQCLVDSLDHHGMRVNVIHEERQEGTLLALKLAARNSRADEFLVILGDILISLLVQQFLNEWKESNTGVAVVVHPSIHPEDSDAALASHDGSVIVVPKSEARDHIPNMSSAGLFTLTKDALIRYGSLRYIGSQVLPAAAAQRDLFAFISSHHLKDIGTLDRLRATEEDVARGAFAQRGQLTPCKALFLDRDGVINPSTPEFYEHSGYSLLPGVAESITTANWAAIPVIVVTNQPAIAKGFMTYEDHQRIRAKMDLLLGMHGAFVDDYLFCPHHPDSGFDGEIEELKIFCDCCKPGIAMAQQAAQRHVLAITKSVIVGDTNRDRDFASLAGMRFIHVTDVCEDDDAADCYEESSVAILRGTEVLGC